jgi:hypothetical protein
MQKEDGGTLARRGGSRRVEDVRLQPGAIDVAKDMDAGFEDRRRLLGDDRGMRADRNECDQREAAQRAEDRDAHRITGRFPFVS